MWLQFSFHCLDDVLLDGICIGHDDSVSVGVSYLVRHKVLLKQLEVKAGVRPSQLWAASHLCLTADLMLYTRMSES